MFILKQFAINLNSRKTFQNTMVEYEILDAKEVKFGRNNFIEVARKRAKTDEGENEFISISRGYYLDDGTKKWKASIALPKEKDKRDEIAELIKNL